MARLWIFGFVRHDSSQRVLAGFIILSLLALMYITIATLHIHIDSDNRIYVHSHPLENSGKSGHHSHSQNEFTYFNLIKNLLQKLLIVSLLLFTVKFLCLYQPRYKSIGFSHPGYFDSITDRAPPQFLLS